MLVLRRTETVGKAQMMWLNCDTPLSQILYMRFIFLTFLYDLYNWCNNWDDLYFFYSVCKVVTWFASSMYVLIICVIVL